MKKPWTDKKLENTDPQNPRPKKSLGQNFLKSDKALRDIRDAADPVASDLILEIGPGLGALTETLLPFPARIIAIEKDDTLSLILEEKFSDEIKAGKLEILNRDILEFDPEILRIYEDGNISRYKIVANIPYNITGAIIRKFLECSYQPQMMVLLIQKEVAERICSRGEKTNKEITISDIYKKYTSLSPQKMHDKLLDEMSKFENEEITELQGKIIEKKLNKLAPYAMIENNN